MPIDFYGYEFDDPNIQRGARQQGLMGALYGMQQGRQDPNDWAGFLTGAATGFDKGYQGYLADYLPIHLQQQREAEAEAERQRQEELAGRRVDYMQPLVERIIGGGGQPPGGDFMGPEQGFGGPSAGDVAQSIPAATPPFVPEAPSESEFIAGLNQGQPSGGVQAPQFDYSIMPSELFGSQGEYANYLQDQLPQIREAREQQEQEAEQRELEGNVANQLQSRGLPVTGDFKTDMGMLQMALERELPMDPYKRETLDLQRARLERQGQGGGAPQLTPSQEFTQRKFHYQDALDRYQDEESPEASADPIFEDIPFVPEGVQLQGGVATGERPMPEQFGMVLPGTSTPPGPSEAPTGTSPAPKQRTLQPAAVKQQAENATKAENIIRSMRLPEVMVDDELRQTVATFLREGRDTKYIRDWIRENSPLHPAWGG